LQWLGYLSTTGVYGDRSGAWVNETTTVKLDNIRSKLRFQSECEWLNFGSQISVSTQIFRLASIYGQNRNALKRLEQETLEPIYKSDQLFSRVHVDDIANILVTSMNLFGASNEIYNICDDLPSSTYEVMEYAAKLLKITIASSTGYNKIQLSKRMQEFYSSNKKVKNDKVKKLLGVTLRYPTYKEGLDAMYKTGNY
jgi:nucleoside-diphosphate-sugar epimerase